MSTLSLKNLVGSVSKRGSRLGFCFFTKFVKIFCFPFPFLRHFFVK